MSLLEVKGLSHTYATGRKALSDVSFSLLPGQRVGLVGPNGAGKSTLLLHLNGVLRPQQGSLLLAAEEVSQDRLGELRQRVGLVFQNADDMLFTTSVRDDVAFGPRQAGLESAEVERRVKDALEAVAATHLADRVPHHLSAGEKRAVAIASVLSMQPEVILLDEPTSDLDPRGRRALQELLKSLDRPLVVASHDLEFVLGLCERTLLLDGGRVVADAETSLLFRDEALMLEHGLERPHSLTPHWKAHEHDHGHAHGHEHGHPHEDSSDPSPETQ